MCGTLIVMSATKAPAAPGSARATVAWGLVAGAGVTLVLAGAGFIVNRWQVREAAAEIGWVREDVGTGFVIAGVVLLGVGLTVLFYAYRRRRWVHRWSIASAAAVVAFVVIGELLAFVVSRYIWAFI